MRLRRVRLTVRTMVALVAAVAEYWARLKGVYIRASWIPWVDLSDSLRHPSWEGDMRPSVCGPR
jgi:hypothetical protein